jgi:mutator protein MutT
MKEVQVVCGVATKNGRVFLARRRPEKSYGGYWELPGGKVEAGEAHEVALARELSEELAVKTKVGSFVATGVDQRPDSHIVLHGYLIEMESQPSVSSDHDRMDWFTENELASLPIPPADLPILEVLFTSAKH